MHGDLNDLYSGRRFPEFVFPAKPRPGSIELVNWVKYFLDRKFKWNDEMRSARHISQMFTWPLTVAWALQQVSGYVSISDIKSNELGLLGEGDSLYIYVVGARQEATLPERVWEELAFLCPDVQVTVHLVGPEVPSSLDGKRSKVSDTLNLAYDCVPFEELSADAPEPDLLVLFNSGVGFQHTQGNNEWGSALQAMLATGKPMLLSSFSQEDAARDEAFIKSLEEDVEVMLECTENPFMNMKKDAARNNYRYMINSNHSVQVIRA